MGAYIGENNKARKIKGAYIGVDGVARKIKKAYIGVDGIAYEVGFDNGMRKITITCDYDGSNNGSVIVSVGDFSYYDSGSCYVEDWGTWTSPTTIEVPIGTPISFSVERNISKAEVILNGTVVFEEYSDYASWYEEYTVTKNVTIAMTEGYYGQAKKYTLTITEE